MVFKHLKFYSLSSKQYFFVGVLIGLLISIKLQNLEQERTVCSLLADAELESGEFEPKVNLAQKPMTAKKVVKNIIRPRYYSSELGIREKLFVGVLSSPDTIDTTATAINRTAAHLVDRIKYFINAENVKVNFKLKNIVGFTDMRENLKPYNVLKYVADNYLDTYDYFLFIPDTAYINARALIDRLAKVSVSQDVYMGQKYSSLDSAKDDDEGRGYYDLSAGIVMSQSVIKKIRANFDWCVRNAINGRHSVNIGKCVKYSTDIRECQAQRQNISVTAFNANNHKIYRDLHYLKDDAAFNEATIVYPLTNPDDFYLLHTYYSRKGLERIEEEINRHTVEYQAVKYNNLPDRLLEKRWPVGVPEAKPAETRHDIITYQHLNETHVFMWDAEQNAKLLPEQDKLDLDNIVQRVKILSARNYPELTYHGIQSAYKKFDPVKGMEYILHLSFTRKKNNAVERVLKSFEIVKPLGAIEVVPSPYVTELTKVNLVVPIFEHQISEAQGFIERYDKNYLENQENTFLLLIFLYGANSPNKDDKDVFLSLKKSTLELTEKYKNDGTKIAWLSIRLPELQVDKKENLLNTVYDRHEILSLAITDLALPKIGLDGLVLIMQNSAKFSPDFLNRVRMNTIQGYQVYSPIGFTNYPCKFTSLCRCDNCDVSQATGYFDIHGFDVVAFYGKDYVEGKCHGVIYQNLWNLFSNLLFQVVNHWKTFCP